MTNDQIPISNWALVIGVWSLYNVLMHPLSVFPQLLTYSLVAPLILRLAVGILRLLAGFARHRKKHKWLAVFYFLSSLFIIVGLYTQIAVIVAVLLVKFDYYMEKKAGTLSPEKKALTILMVVILLSLLLTGPGLFAFDLPL